MRLSHSVLMVWVVSLVLGAPAWAESDAKKGYVQLLNEVFQAEPVYPQDMGQVQLTLVPTYSKGTESKVFELPLEIEYGITDSWQVGLDVLTFQQENPESGPTQSGTGDLALTTKYAFMNIGGSDFHASLNFEVKFPTASVGINKNASDGFTVYQPSLSLAKDFTGNNSQVFTQVGVGFLDRTREPRDPANPVPEHTQFFWHSGYFIPYSNQIIFSGEFSWIRDESTLDGRQNQLYLTPGVIWVLPGQHWQMGLGVPVGLNNDSDDYQVILGLIYEFDT